MKVEVKRHKGILKVSINGKIYNPLSFKSFRANPKNVSEFYDAGVRLFSVLTSGVTSAIGVPYSLYGESWIGENKYDFSAIDKQMDMFLENAPEGYFAPMIQLDTRDWYLKLHPEVPNSFTHLSQIAYDETWRKAAAEYMKAAIRHCEEKYGERIYGYFMLCGTTTEWFSHFDYEASHPIKEKGYRKWRGDENAVLPSLEALNRKGNVFLEQDENDVYFARKFHNETIADLILYFAKEAQQVIGHKKLLGLYYGYLLELGGERLYNDGSLAYEKVFFSDDIDMISSPSAYGYRKLSDPSAYMLTQRTLDAHNKLYFLEFDHLTHIAPEEIHENVDESSQNKQLVRIPGAGSKCKNERESINLMYRDFLLCNANMSALWWFDMFDGWFRSDRMMDAIKKMIRISEELGNRETKRDAEIAVFAEGESMYRVRKSSGIASICLSDIRRTLAECGASYDIYSVSDVFLPQIEDYKMYVFVNQYDISDTMKKHIEKYLYQQGKTVLWLYAPDYAGGGANDVAQVSEMTKINVTIGDRAHGGLCFEGKKMDADIAGPYFEIEDAETEAIACFEDGSVAVAYKEINGYRTVYSAVCKIPSDLLRHIARMAGVFVYSDNSKVYTYTNSECIGVYNATEKDAFINVKEDGVYVDLFSGESFEGKNGILRIPQRSINAFMFKTY